MRNSRTSTLVPAIIVATTAGLILTACTTEGVSATTATPAASQMHAAGQAHGGGQGGRWGQGGGQRSASSSELSDTTAAQLLVLAEEEKVAHDLYALAYDTYGIQTFANIQGAESRHLDAMNRIVTRYDLGDTFELGTPGEFESAELQDLYDGLAERIMTSEEEAVAVGVAVERRDIRDLTGTLADELPWDVERVLTNLRAASEHHLEAFRSLQG
ncbi:MAG: DUF2202 domain-containing protein [Actinobacteria bacterium]|nr:DUF2202 domain-containing protein [Actinomycetota bacterium]